jgi:hypothetical protein
MLLQEIRDGAVDSKTDITTVLRKCLVLAAKLRHEGFRKWVEQELNGYQGDRDDLPPYRVLHVESLGYFVGRFGAQIATLRSRSATSQTGCESSLLRCRWWIRSPRSCP